MTDRSDERREMVARHIAARGVRDDRVLDAMEAVPREVFVPESERLHAYADRPLPIAERQTISQPYIVARMAEAAGIGPEDRVLEVGAGSGYAAAILARLAGTVTAVERLSPLAQGAREALATAGAGNVEVVEGDGTRGWPQGAPFDAILVAAAAPQVPQPLREQLAPGGRLVIPVGPPGNQRLLRITRSAAGWQEEDLGGVAFVPLVGHGAFTAAGRPWPGPDAPLLQRIAAALEPLGDEDALGVLADRWRDARVVLIGDGTHGTSEFYAARAALTRRLIERHGFTDVALEADWPDAARLDAVARGRPHEDGAPPFARFPQWMWRNEEVAAFASWLRGWNAERSEATRVALRGLDIYALGSAMRAVVDYLDRTDPEAAATARERYGCLEPWREAPEIYGRLNTEGYGRCEAAAVAQCQELLARALDRPDGEAVFDAAQNARLVASAERYYRVMYAGSAESWNLRDRHMAETLEAVLERRGPRGKIVVWAHNSHVGDARATAMGRRMGELSLGQLARERWGRDAVLVGMGTDRGTVAAASRWDGEMEVKRVRPSLEGSVERLFVEAGVPRAFLDLRAHPDLAPALDEPRLERFIGVIYRPETERASHYAEASLAAQFDAWLWFEETTPVSALPPVEEGSHQPDTWPFGL